MLKHTWSTPQKPARVCLLGGKGFVASSVSDALNEHQIPVETIGSNAVDLTAPGAGKQLADRLRPDDALVFISARAPCKTPALFMENMAMANAVAEAIVLRSPAHLVYISSDAVYPDHLDLVREEACAQPDSLHGAMHVARESILKAVFKGPLAILRPSLLYGATDPHNGYGPNRSMRLAAAGETITLFGEGEEQRDHVWIRDVAEIVRLTLMHRSTGLLNIATGHSFSFRAVAEQVVSLFDTPVAIQGTPRQNPITHRHYDITASHKAFPGFHYTSLQDGLAATHRLGMAPKR